jgi:two-component system CheB/CheR fusion protein
MNVREQEVRGKDGRWYSLRIRPYRTLENKIDGATVTFLDIDALKKSRQAEAVFETIREPLLMLTSKLRVLSANRPFLRLLGLDEQSTLNQPLYEIAGGQLDVPELRSLLEDALYKKQTVEEFKVELATPKSGKKTLLLNARRIKADANGEDILLLAMEDATPRNER